MGDGCPLGMAKRTRMPRGPTTVTEFPVANTANQPGLGGWIDIPGELSKVNHRLYRQHKNYYAEVVLNTAVQTTQPILVYTLSPTWYVSGALRAAKKEYDKAMRDERNVVKQARWHDFRIDTDINSTFYAKLQAYGLDQAMTGAQAHVADELERSLVVDANDVARCFTLRSPTGTVVAGATAFNIFEEYDAMDNVDVDTPVIAGGVAPYDDFREESDTENMQFLQTVGDEPPYNALGFDALWTQVGELHSNNAGNQQATTGFFQAPLGLVLLVGVVDASIEGGSLTIDRTRVTVNVLPGAYKGVYADAL